jgi:hypothetical protein
MVMLPEGGDPDPLQLYVKVTTICVVPVPAFTLKLYGVGGETVKVTVTVWLFTGLVHEALTTMLKGPMPVVIRVGTESVAVLGNVFIEFGAMVEVTPGGLPETTLRLTVPLKPPEAARLSVYRAVTPAPTLHEGGVAVIEKSLGGGPIMPLIDMTSPALNPIGAVAGNAPYVGCDT